MADLERIEYLKSLIPPDLLKKINDEIPGEISIADDDWIWYQEDDTEEAADNLWTDYCEAAEVIRRELPNCEIVDNWADNDSAGFTLKFK